MPTQQRTILLVDDDHEILESMRTVLENKGFRILAARDGNAGLMIAEREVPDLLVLDIHLSDVSGPTLCERIRENERYRKTPVILLTVASPLDPHTKESLHGGNDCLAKPFNAAELAVKAETWIWKNRLGLL